MRVDPPGAVHSEVGVQREAVAEAEELVLSPRDHLADPDTGQISGCQGGHPKLGSGQRPASKHLVQPLACSPDGVSLGHGLIVPCRSQQLSLFLRAAAVRRTPLHRLVGVRERRSRVRAAVRRRQQMCFRPGRRRTRRLPARHAATEAINQTAESPYPWDVPAPEPSESRKRWLLRWSWFMAGLGMAGLAAVVGSVGFVRARAAGHIYTEADVP